MAGEASLIDAQGAEAIQLYTSLLKSYPDYPRNDQVLYQLARAYETTGQPEKALATLDDVMRRYPRTPQMDEVQFRRGELLFSAKQYQPAQDAYGYVVSRGEKSSFLTQSLYKHGWSLFKQGLNDDSLPSFAGVLDRTMLTRRPQADSRSRSCRAPTASWPTTRCASWPSRSRTTTIRWPPSTGSSPGTTTRPTRPSCIRASAICMSRRSASRTRPRCIAPSPRATRTASSRRACRCRPSRPTARADSPSWCSKASASTSRCTTTAPTFWQGRNKADYPNIAKELKINLKDVATYFHANAQKIEEARRIPRGGALVPHLSRILPGRSGILRHQLPAVRDAVRGEGLPGRGRGIHTHRVQLSAQSAFRGRGLCGARLATRSTRTRCPRRRRPRRTRQAVDAGIKFGTSFPEHPDSAGVLTRAAEDIFATQDLQRSIEVANLVLAHQPPADAPKRRIAYTIIGQANFDLLQFAEAEKGYIAARELLPPNDKMRADLTERIASSVYRQAEAKQKGGDAAGAVEDFLRIAQVAGTSKIAAQAEYDAGAQLIQLKDWPRAITVLERFRATNPKSEFTPDVTRKLAVAYSETGQAGQAAVEFERIALNPGGDARRAARGQSARPRICTPRPATRRRPSACSSASSSHTRRRWRIPSRRARSSPTSPAPRVRPTNNVTGSARSSPRTAPPAPGAPIAHNSSPRSRSSRWPRRRATSSATSRWCCRSSRAWRRNARPWRRRSAATRARLTTAWPR